MNIRDRFDREKFTQIYKGTGTFCETKYFGKFIELLGDEIVLEHIKFANDVLGVPPVESMIKYYRTFFNELMLPSEKQGLGACFGYLYRFIYKNYEAEQVWVGDIKITGIKTASIFKNMKIKNTIFDKKGQEVKCLDEWPRPKKPEIQWKDGRSAKEFAKYMLAGNSFLPKELAEIIIKHSANTVETKIFPEKVTGFGTGFGSGGSRNHDALIISDNIVLGVEAKGEEVFGDDFSEKDSVTRRKRFDMFCKTIYGNNGGHYDIKFQLLSASVALLKEAHDRQKKIAVLVIITFLKEGCFKQKNIDKNKKALEDYKKSLGAQGLEATVFGKENDIEFFIDEITIILD